MHLHFVSFSQANFSHSFYLPPPLCGDDKALTGSKQMEHLLSVSGAAETIQEDPLGSYPHLAMPLWSSFHWSWKRGQKNTEGTSSQLLRQDYKALQERCLRDGCLFEDDIFPATLSSIGSRHLLQKLPGPLQWKRPTVRDGEGAST